MPDLTTRQVSPKPGQSGLAALIFPAGGPKCLATQAPGGEAEFGSETLKLAFSHLSLLTVTTSTPDTLAFGLDRKRDSCKARPLTVT